MKAKSTFVSVLLVSLILLISACGGDDSFSPDPDDSDGDQNGNTETPDEDEISPDGDDVTPDGDADDTGEEGEAPPEPGPIDIDEVAGLMHAFDFTDDSYLFSAPFPNDFYIGEDGLVDLPGFPNPKNSSMASDFIAAAEDLLDGFGVNTPSYWVFEAPLDLTSLPADPADTLSWDSSLLLINIDPASPRYGNLNPLEWHWNPEANVYEVANMLAVAPYDGFPLDPLTTYAMVLTDSLTDVDGNPLGRPKLLADLLSGREDGALADAYKPLANWLGLDTTPLVPERVRAATVFTTLDTIGEVKAIRDYLVDEYPNGAVSGDLVDCTFDHAENGYLIFKGHYTAPNFQEGDVPYASEGGNIYFGENGDPIVQMTETLRFAVTIPMNLDVPAAGWPIAMISHGTGGRYNSYIRGGGRSRSVLLTEAGLATIGIDQPLHGDRGNEATNVELHTFNFFNPESGRSVFRQSAIDTVSLTRLIVAGVLRLDKSVCDSWPTEAVYTGPDEIVFDPELISFHGHSQGGMSGSLAAAVEDDVQGWVLSGAGGRLAITVLEREDPDLLGLMTPMIGIQVEEAHKHHPIVGLLQWLTEITDMINYAPYWIGYPHDGRPKHMMLTSGFVDPYTPKNTAFALAVAGRVPLLEEVHEAMPGLELRGLSAFARPATLNIMAPNGQRATAGFCQYPEDGHFAVFDNDDAAWLYQEFLRSLSYAQAPVLGY